MNEEILGSRENKKYNPDLANQVNEEHAKKLMIEIEQKRLGNKSKEDKSPSVKPKDESREIDEILADLNVIQSACDVSIKYKEIFEAGQNPPLESVYDLVKNPEGLTSEGIRIFSRAFCSNNFSANT